MSRIDAFEGSEVEYAAYLLSRLTSTPTEVIECLENAVNRSRQLLPANDQPQFIFCIGREESEVKQNIPKWHEATRSFFSHIPCDEEDWAAKRQAVCLSSTDDILRAVETLAGHSSCLVVPNSSQDEHFLVRLGIRAGQLVSEAKFAEKISHYLAVVFAATCLVAEELDLPEATLDEAMLAFLVATRRKDVAKNPSTFRKIRRTGGWIVLEMQRLCLLGLRHRASEIFFHGGCPLSTYLKFPRAGDDENECFTTKIMSSQSEICQIPPEKHASLPLWIPFIIKMIVREKWSFTCICQKLNTSILDRDEDFDAFIKIYRSRELVVGQLWELYCLGPDYDSRKRIRTDKNIPDRRRKENRHRKFPRKRAPEAIIPVQSATNGGPAAIPPQFQSTALADRRAVNTAGENNSIPLLRDSTARTESETRDEDTDVASPNAAVPINDPEWHWQALDGLLVNSQAGWDFDFRETDVTRAEYAR